jgi:hypothetical protein
MILVVALKPGFELHVRSYNGGGKLLFATFKSSLKGKRYGELLGH